MPESTSQAGRASADMDTQGTTPRWPTCFSCLCSPSLPLLGLRVQIGGEVVLPAYPFEPFVLGDRGHLDGTSHRVRARHKARIPYRNVDKELRQVNGILNRHGRFNKRSAELFLYHVECLGHLSC